MRNETKYKDNPLIMLSFDFALNIIEFSVKVREAGFPEIARQLIKSGTSIGANARESQNASSKADFVNKIKIAAKEAEETDYWLLLCEKSPLLPDPNKLVDEILVLLKILNKILGTTSRNNYTFSH